MINPISKIYQIIKYKGIGFCAFRFFYALRKRFGLLKRHFKTDRWDDINLNDWVKADFSIDKLLDNCGGFFFGLGKPPKNDRFKSQSLLDDADNILNGKFRYFFNEYKSLGENPDWYLNPFTGKRGNDTRHWCDIGHFDKNVGDIKFIWEPSRFAWVYSLVRAYSFTGDDKYAQKCWQLLESWLDRNQPNIGSNYVCGQECAIRVFAMCFGLFGLYNAESSSKDRIEKLLKAIAVHTDRIQKNISYAISTKTNHSITEAAGIYTVGLLFPFFAESAKWKAKGKKILVKEGLKQIYDDGSYIQHSMNYHRLMLQDYIWFLRLAELNNDRFDNKLIERVKRAIDFIYQTQDETGGRVPNYGANDGAVIIPLNSCDYLDYRGVIGAGFYLFYGNRSYQAGLWDEDLLWLFGDNALESSVNVPIKRDLAADTGGYYTLRTDDSFAFVRCHSFKDRPGHSDMLSVDLWWDGVNVLRDSGSYLYNCDDKWLNYFMGSNSHNTVRIDDQDQMKRAGLWNWYYWTKSKLIRFDVQNRDKYFLGVHYGYKRLGLGVVHKRTIYYKEGFWVVEDEITGRGCHKLELNWNLADQEIKLMDDGFIMNTDAGSVRGFVFCDKGFAAVKLYEGDDSVPIGFESLYYGSMKAAPVLTAICAGSLPIRFVSLFSLGRVINDIEYKNGKIFFHNNIISID